MNESLLQCLYVSVSDHATPQLCTLHAFDATLQLHLQRASDNYTRLQLCRLMSRHPKHKQEEGLITRGLGRQISQCNHCVCSFIKARNVKQEKSLPPGNCAWLTTHPSPSSFCPRERRPLSHPCQKAGGNNSPGGVSHRGPPAEPGTPCGGELEPSPALLLQTHPLYMLTLISLRPAAESRAYLLLIQQPSSEGRKKNEFTVGKL